MGAELGGYRDPNRGYRERKKGVYPDPDLEYIYNSRGWDFYVQTCASNVFGNSQLLDSDLYKSMKSQPLDPRTIQCNNGSITSRLVVACA